MSLRKLTLEVEGLKVTVEGLTSSGSQQQPPSGLQSIRLNHPRSSTASSFDLVSEPGNSEAAYPQEPPLPVPFFAEDPTPLVGLGSPGSLSTAPHQPAGSIPALASGRSGYNRSLLPLSPPSSQPSTSQVPEYPLQGATAPSGLDQPPIPGHLLDLGRRLTSHSGFSGEDRCRRAWTAGWQARLVLTDRVRFPSATPPIGLRNQYYCILRSSGAEAPVVCRTYKAFIAITGPLSEGDSVTHAFASESEARIYFAGAGLRFPGHEL